MVLQIAGTLAGIVVVGLMVVIEILTRRGNDLGTTSVQAVDMAVLIFAMVLGVVDNLACCFARRLCRLNRPCGGSRCRDTGSALGGIG